MQGMFTVSIFSIVTLGEISDTQCPSPLAEDSGTNCPRGSDEVGSGTEELLLGELERWNSWPSSEEAGLFSSFGSAGPELESSPQAQNDTVLFSAHGGFYDDVFDLELFNYYPQNHIHYTINGSHPTMLSPVYRKYFEQMHLILLYFSLKNTLKDA